MKDLRDWMGSATHGNVAILSPDFRTWEKLPNIEDDLLTFENSRMDDFTFFLNYTIVDLYHSLIGKHFNVRDQPAVTC
jgi:hypothetical protein